MMTSSMIFFCFRQLRDIVEVTTRGSAPSGSSLPDLALQSTQRAILKLEKHRAGRVLTSLTVTLRG